MSTGLKFFNTYLESEKTILKLSDEQAGKLFKAKFRFFFDDVEPDFSADERLETAWDYEVDKLERDKHSSYVRSVEAMYKVYLRELDDREKAMNREAWYIAMQSNPFQVEYPSKALSMVTIEDMRELDIKAGKKKKKVYSNMHEGSYENYDELPNDSY